MPVAFPVTNPAPILNLGSAAGAPAITVLGTSGLVAGETLVAEVYYGGGSSFTPDLTTPSGWTLVGSSVPNTLVGLWVYTRTSTATSADNFPFVTDNNDDSFGSATWGTSVTRATGGGAVTAAFANATSGTPTAPTGGGASGDGYVSSWLGAFSSIPTAPTWTTPGSMTQQFRRPTSGLTGTSLALATEILGTAGTRAATPSATNNEWVAVTVRIAAAGGTTPVGNTRSTTWHTRTGISGSRSTTWHTHAATTGTRATTWHTRAGVTGARSTTWNVTGSVSATRATAWTTLASVAGSRPTTWGTFSATIGNRATTWNALAGVSGARPTTWNVATSLTSVTVNRSTTWNVRALVASARGTTWNVTVVVVPTPPMITRPNNEVTYRITGSTPRTRSITYRPTSGGWSSGIWGGGSWGDGDPNIPRPDGITYRPTGG